MRNAAVAGANNVGHLFMNGFFVAWSSRGFDQ